MAFLNTFLLSCLLLFFYFGDDRISRCYIEVSGEFIFKKWG